MKEFMYIFRGGDTGANQSPEAMQQNMQKWVKWMEELGKQDKLVGGQPLAPGGMTITGSKMTRTDGPFAEGKELVGGYLIVKAADLGDAVLLSKECPIYADEGSVEVREVMQM